MAEHKPTAEQQQIVAAYCRGDSLVIQAGAGTGKTTTLRTCALAKPNRTATYLAYNRAIKDEAGRTFPRNVTCVTAHGAAFRAVGQRYRERLDGGRMPARMVAQALGIREPLPIRIAPGDDKAGLLWLDPTRLARITMATLGMFYQSADSVIDAKHVPEVKRIDSDEARAQLEARIVPLAREAWADVQRIDGRLPFTHDAYLKIWQLSSPRLPTDVVLLDEAQDTNPCVAAIVDAQDHAQRVLVGDSAQQLYGWRGAVDAMDAFEADSVLVLSQSFRFGPAVADEANKWLELLSAKLRLTGNPALPSKLQPVTAPRAILCRTNAGVIGESMQQLELGRKVGLLGDHAKQIRALAEAAVDLQANRGTAHPELIAFTTWAELQDYVRDDASGSDLRVFVEQIDDRGPAAVMALCDRLVDEQRADVLVTTGHKAKGREWHSVRVASDFRAPKGDRLPSAAECMLAYVTVTRAQIELDRTGLAWVDGYVGGDALFCSACAGTGVDDDGEDCEVCFGTGEHAVHVDELPEAERAQLPLPAVEAPAPLRADLRSLLVAIGAKPQLLAGDSLERGRELEARKLVVIHATADRMPLAIATAAGEAEIGGAS